MLLLVNGEIVDEADVRLEVARIRDEFLRSTDITDPVKRDIRLRDSAREIVVERILLRQAARSTTSGDVDALLKEAMRAAARPDFEELREYYKQHRRDFLQPESIHAAHIVKNVDKDEDEEPALEIMQSVLVELAAGADFATLADRVSDCKGEGGDLGWFPRGAMVPEFEAAVFALKPGRTSGIFRTPFGFHVARVFARKPERWLNFEQARSRIDRFLHEQRQRWAVENFVAGLKRKAKFERIHESLLHS